MEVAGRGQVSARARSRWLGGDVYYSARVSLGAWAHGPLRSGRLSEPKTLVRWACGTCSGVRLYLTVWTV
jgi:hypothetical protein